MKTKIFLLLDLFMSSLYRVSASSGACDSDEPIENAHRLIQFDSKEVANLE